MSLGQGHSLDKNGCYFYFLARSIAFRHHCRSCVGVLCKWAVDLDKAQTYFFPRLFFVCVFVTYTGTSHSVTPLMG